MTKVYIVKNIKYNGNICAVDSKRKAIDWVLYLMGLEWSSTKDEDLVSSAKKAKELGFNSFKEFAPELKANFDKYSKELDYAIEETHFCNIGPF